MLKRAFNEHPQSVGESYTEHMGVAFGFGAKMITAGVACLLHGLFPFLFVKSGSKCIEELHHRMVAHRQRKPLEAHLEAHAGVAMKAAE